MPSMYDMDIHRLLEWKRTRPVVVSRGSSMDRFLLVLSKAGLVSTAQYEELNAFYGSRGNVQELVDTLLARGLLTPWQTEAVLKGRCTGFEFGDFRAIDAVSISPAWKAFVLRKPGEANCVLGRAPLPQATCEPNETLLLAERRSSLGVPHCPKIQGRASSNGVEVVLQPLKAGMILAELIPLVALWSRGAAFRLTTQLVAAVGAAHNAGFCFLDIQPYCLNITPSLEVELLSFGIDMNIHRTKFLQSGCADFVAPECHAGNGDFRSDYFSIGRLLVGLLERSDADQSTVEIIRSICAIDPALRPQSLPELIDRLAIIS